MIANKIRENSKIFVFLLFLFLINCGVTIYLVTLFVQIIRTSSVDPKFIEIGVISFSIVLLLVISSLLLGIMIREFAYCSRCRISTVLNQMERKRGGSLCVNLNNSKGRIHPLNITEMDDNM